MYINRSIVFEGTSALLDMLGWIILEEFCSPCDCPVQQGMTVSSSALMYLAGTTCFVGWVVVAWLVAAWLVTWAVMAWHDMTTKLVNPCLPSRI